MYTCDMHKMKCNSCVYAYTVFVMKLSFLNQVHAGLRPAHACFLKLFLCRRLYVCVFVCVSAPEDINN